MTVKRQSLVDFAAANAAHTKPWLETIPEYDEIVAAYLAGVSGSQILAWLIAPPPDGCGYPKNVATRNRVQRLLREKVGRDGTSATH